MMPLIFAGWLSCAATGPAGASAPPIPWPFSVGVKSLRDSETVFWTGQMGGGYSPSVDGAMHDPLSWWDDPGALLLRMDAQGRFSVDVDSLGRYTWDGTAFWFDDVGEAPPVRWPWLEPMVADLVAEVQAGFANSSWRVITAPELGLTSRDFPTNAPGCPWAELELPFAWASPAKVLVCGALGQIRVVDATTGEPWEGYGTHNGVGRPLLRSRVYFSDRYADVPLDPEYLSTVYRRPKTQGLISEVRRKPLVAGGMFYHERQLLLPLRLRPELSTGLTFPPSTGIPKASLRLSETCTAAAPWHSLGSFHWVFTVDPLEPRFDAAQARTDTPCTPKLQVAPGVYFTMPGNAQARVAYQVRLLDLSLPEPLLAEREGGKPFVGPTKGYSGSTPEFELPPMTSLGALQLEVSGQIEGRCTGPADPAGRPTSAHASIEDGISGDAALTWAHCGQ